MTLLYLEAAGYVHMGRSALQPLMLQVGSIVAFQPLESASLRPLMLRILQSREGLRKAEHEVCSFQNLVTVLLCLHRLGCTPSLSLTSQAKVPDSPQYRHPRLLQPAWLPNLRAGYALRQSPAVLTDWVVYAMHHDAAVNLGPWPEILKAPMEHDPIWAGTPKSLIRSRTLFLAGLQGH